MRVVDASEEDVVSQRIFQVPNQSGVEDNNAIASSSKAVASADDALTEFTVAKKPRLSQTNEDADVTEHTPSTSDPSSGTLSSKSDCFDGVEQPADSAGFTKIRAMSIDEYLSD